MPHLSTTNPGLGHRNGDPNQPPIGTFDDEAPEDGGLDGETRETSEAKLVVPANLEPIIRSVSQGSGVPFHVIAGAIQTSHGSWNDRIVPELIAEVAAAIAAGRPSTAQELNDPHMWEGVAFEVLGNGSLKWLDRYREIVYPTITVKSGQLDQKKTYTLQGEPDYRVGDEQQPLSPGKHWIPKVGAFGGYYINVAGTGEAQRPVDIADVYNAFEQFTGRTPSEAEAQRYVGLTYDAMRAAILARPESREWRVQGPKITAIRGWVNERYARYLGREATNEEILEVSKRGHTPQTLETYLRSRPSGTTTLGVMADTRVLADRYASDFVGRDADPGEINWIITHNVQTPEGIEAFYEQLRTRIETNDPNFAWAVDPRTWRTRQSDLASAWKQAGLLGDPPPQMVNRSLAEKWDAERTEDEISALPAPGFEGTTVGEVNRARAVAKRWKAPFFPGQDVTTAELKYVMPMHPEEVRRYYRSLGAETKFDPAGPAPKGDPEKGAGALRGVEYTEPEKIDIKPAPLPGGVK